MKKEIKNPQNPQWEPIVLVAKTNTAKKNSSIRKN